MGLNFVKIGLHPGKIEVLIYENFRKHYNLWTILQIHQSWLFQYSGMAATHFLPNLVGPSTATSLLLTGKIIGAEEALNSGLVSKVNRECLFTPKLTVYYSIISIIIF